MLILKQLVNKSLIVFLLRTLLVLYIKSGYKHSGMKARLGHVLPSIPHPPKYTHTFPISNPGPREVSDTNPRTFPGSFHPNGYLSSALSDVCMFHVFRCCKLVHVPVYLTCSHVVHTAWVRAPCMSGYAELSLCFILQRLSLVLASSHGKEKTKFLEEKHLLFSMCATPHAAQRHFFRSGARTSHMHLCDLILPARMMQIWATPPLSVSLRPRSDPEGICSPSAGTAVLC